MWERRGWRQYAAWCCSRSGLRFCATSVTAEGAQGWRGGGGGRRRHRVEEGVVEAAVEGVGQLDGEHADGELELEVGQARHVDVLHLPPVGHKHVIEHWRVQAGAVRQEEEERLTAGCVGRGVEEVLEGGDGCAADVKGVGGGVKGGGR